MRPLRGRAAAILLALLPATAARAEGPAELDEKLAGARAAVERIARDETDVASELESAERALRDAEESRDLAARELEEARRALSALRLEEVRARDALAAGEAALAPRLRARYRILRRGTAGALLLAPSPAALVRLDRAFDRLLAADLELVRGMRASIEALERTRTEAEAAERAVAERALAFDARVEAARTQAEARAALLATLREEKRVAGKVVAELSAARRRLDAELARLRLRAEAPKTGFGALRGSLPRPVEGAVVEVAFGRVINAQFGTVTNQNGLDLRVHEGAKVSAVAKGSVVFAGWFRGYGNLVIVDHGDGYHTLYAHLKAVAVEVGDAAEEGTLVGLVGDTGSLKGAYLYFELRHGGKPLDPMGWFRRG